jgi:hypothetical protein
MSEIIPPSTKALEEALSLSSEILRNIELSKLPLANIALKTSRLARLLNEHDIQRIMELEVMGYPSTTGGVTPDVWQLAVMAGRRYEQEDSITNETKEYIYLESIEALEHEVKMAPVALDAARDPNISISSSNPYQSVPVPQGHGIERHIIKASAATASKRLSERRALIYGYVLRKHYELKFSGIADDVFSRIRERVDSAIGKTVPTAVKKIAAVYDNLKSENAEDWANAVHGCRRILQDLADAVFPPQEEDRIVYFGGKQKKVKLGKDNYINRIMAFVDDHSSSGRFNDIVGSNLSFLGDRLDAAFQAAQKGSHDIIISREEADRYVVYTYLIVGDVLSLLEGDSI